MQFVVLYYTGFFPRKVGALLFGAYNISPKISISPTNSTQSPTFTWTAPGNVNLDYIYTIYIVDKNLSGFITSSITGTSYTYSPEAWNSVITTFPNGFVWCVAVDCTTSPSTGQYLSSFQEYNYSVATLSLNIVRAGSVSYVAPYTATNGTFIPAATTAKWYKFTAPVTAEYTFTSSGNIDTYGEIFPHLVANGITTDRLAYNDDGGENSNFLIEYTMNEGDVIYLRVRGFNSSHIGSFTVKATINATEIIETKTTYNNTLNAGEKQWFSFTPQNTGTYTICSLGNIDVVCRMYNSSGSLIERNDDAGISLNFSLTKNLYAGSIYYFKIEGFSGNTSGDYQFFIIPTPTIIYNSSYSDFMESGEYFWYKFQAPSAGTYTFYTSSNDFLDTCGSLYSDINPSGDSRLLLAYNDDYDPAGDNFHFRITYELQTNETVYLQIRGYDEFASGDFTLYIDYEPTVIELETSNNVHIVDSHENWFKFTAPYAGDFIFYTIGDVDTFGELFNNYEYGTTDIPITYNDDGEYEMNCSIVYYLEAGQTIYFRVQGYSSSTQGSTLVYVTKYQIATYNVVNNISLDIGEVTWFKFTAPANNTYTFIVYGFDDVNIELYGFYNYQVLSSSSKYARSTQQLVNFEMLAGETIYISIQRGLASTSENFEFQACTPVG